MLRIGDKAPDFSVKDDHGNPVSLADYRGKTLVLWFFPKAHTPGCTAEGCGFRDLRRDFEAKDVAIAGVSFDDPETNRSFSEKHGFGFPLLSDEEHTLALAYGAADDSDAKSAKRIAVVVGPDGSVRAAYPKVNARTFPAELYEQLFGDESSARV